MWEIFIEVNGLVCGVEICVLWMYRVIVFGKEGFWSVSLFEKN